jgi:hypothetical protein
MQLRLGQQALFAFVDALAKMLLSYVPEPPRDVHNQSIARAKPGDDRSLKNNRTLDDFYALWRVGDASVFTVLREAEFSDLRVTLFQNARKTPHTTKEMARRLRGAFFRASRRYTVIDPIEMYVPIHSAKK